MDARRSNANQIHLLYLPFSVVHRKIIIIIIRVQPFPLSSIRSLPIKLYMAPYCLYYHHHHHGTGTVMETTKKETLGDGFILLRAYREKTILKWANAERNIELNSVSLTCGDCIARQERLKIKYRVK